MSEKETLKMLTVVTRQKERWPERFADWLALLENESAKVRAKALWLNGEAGYAYPDTLTPIAFERVSQFICHSDALLRARAATALGRMGRGNPAQISEHIASLIALLSDADENVRLSAIWACETLRPPRRNCLRITCACLKCSYPIPPTGCAWKRLKSSASWESDFRKPFSPIGKGLWRYRNAMKTG